MSNLVSLTYYIYSTVQRYDKEREKTNKFQVLSSSSIFTSCLPVATEFNEGTK